MKKIKLWLVLTAFLTAFCACSPDKLPSPIVDETPAPDESTPSPPPSTIPSGVVTEDDSRPPRDGMVRSPLTNEWVDADVAATRPIAVIIPNESNAIPHYNLSEASVLYEAVVEGRMTRMMAIFENWENLSKIGNVRSLRTYYAYWAFEWDAFIVHYGGPFFINDLLAEPDTQTIDGLQDSTAFFRSADRPAPHNSYATGSGLLNVIKKNGYSLSPRGLADENHFQFASKATPNDLTQYGTFAKNATYIDMSSCYPLTRCYFEYDEDKGLYYRSQYLSGSSDGPHMDAATNRQLSFKNIIIQNTKWEEIMDGYLAFQCHDTSMDGWYFTNGKGIHISWSKTDDYSATRYYDDFGNEILMNTGKTMICIVPEGSTFTYR